MQTRSLEVRSSSFDAAANTVQVCWSAGSTVKRQGWDGPYWEVLAMGAEDVRLEWMNSGKCPFLNTHQSSDVADVFGNVVAGSAYLRDGKGFATIRLTSRAGAADTIADIKSGVLRNVSVGYELHRIEQQKAGADDVPIVRVVDFEPLEVSCVPVPADKEAEIRSFPATSSLGRHKAAPAALLSAIRIAGATLGSTSMRTTT
jgi:HK97 family phage prohead protease